MQYRSMLEMAIPSIIIALVAVCSTVYVSAQIYVDNGNPYEPGPFDVNFTYFSVLSPDEDKPPYHSTAFYPLADGLFGVYYFITGFFGVTGSGGYDEIFQNIAAHGYVVFVTWNAGEGTGIDKHIEHIDWLRENSPGEMGGAIPSFDHMTISCHSAGCAPHIKLMVNYTDMWMASVNFDPSTFSIGRYDLDFGIPVLNLGSEYGKINPNATCVFPTLDYLAWHEKSVCPRIMMEAEDVGHCGVLDNDYWADCVESCGGPPTDDNVTEFRNVLKGNAVAFTNSYVQGNMDQLKYVANRTLIPWTMLTFESDVDCEVP